MYYIYYGISGPSLLIESTESTDSMIHNIMYMYIHVDNLKF